MSNLRVLAWNVKTGNQGAIDALSEMVDQHTPDSVVLIEVAYLYERLRKWADAHGYALFMEEPLHWRRGAIVPEQGDTAVLVRKGVVVREYHVTGMWQTWIGPVNGWLHGPRRYWRLRLQKGAQKWRLSAEHWPTKQPKNIKAQTETKARAKSWLRRGVRSPSVLVGDLNNPTASLAADFPKASVIGNGPDNAIFKRCAGGRVVLGNYGSDHRAVVYTFTK